MPTTFVPNSDSRTHKIRFSTNLVDDLTFLTIGIYVIVTAVSPYMYGRYLAIPLAIITIVRICTRRIPLSALYWTITLGSLGLLGTLIGFNNGNPGAIATTSIYVLEPLLFGILFGSLAFTHDWEPRLIRVLDIALVSVAITGFAVYAAQLADSTLPEWLVDPTWSYADLQEGTIRTNFQGYNSLIFLAPYGIVRSLNFSTNSSKYWRFALLISSMSGLVLSGRRILYIAVPVAVVAIILVRLLSNREQKELHRRLIEKRPSGEVIFGLAGLSTTLVVLTGFLGISLKDTFQRMASQFTLGGQDDKRVEQGELLLNEWLDRPLLGKGSGATVDGYTRNAESPWAFELSYHSILLNFGLIGLIVLLGWGAWMMWSLAKTSIRRETNAAAILAGLISASLCIYVDPYVQKIDGMWMLFIPFAAAIAYQLTPTHTKN